MDNSEKYNKSNKVVYLTQYHFIWCTKYRRDVLNGEVSKDLKEIIETICAESNSEIKALEIMLDHVHLFASIHYRLSPGKFIKMIKGRSSNLLRKKYIALRSRIPTLWTRSFFISSVGTVSAETIKNYIENQKNK